MNDFNEKFRSTLAEQMTYLPEITQKALKSFDWATQLLSIGKEYGLHIDQLEDLQLETMLVLVGIIPAESYETELETKLAISPAEAVKIIQAVNTQIFIPIHDYIVNDGDKKSTMTPETSETNVMESAGFHMTDDETPITIKTEPVRVGGVGGTTQSIPESKPEPILQANGAPLQFHPDTAAVQPLVAEPIPVASQTVSLSKEKLEKMYQDRQKTIDATLQSMDQIS